MVSRLIDRFITSRDVSLDCSAQRVEGKLAGVHENTPPRSGSPCCSTSDNDSRIIDSVVQLLKAKGVDVAELLAVSVTHFESLSYSLSSSVIRIRIHIESAGRRQAVVSRNKGLFVRATERPSRRFSLARHGGKRHNGVQLPMGVVYTKTTAFDMVFTVIFYASIEVLYSKPAALDMVSTLFCLPHDAELTDRSTSRDPPYLAFGSSRFDCWCGPSHAGQQMT